jgi:hypothetical protein
VVPVLEIPDGDLEEGRREKEVEMERGDIGG